MKAMRKVLYLLLVLGGIVCCSSVTRMKNIPSIAIDKHDSDTIIAKSIPLQKGKVCILYTTCYENELPIKCNLKNKTHADFSSKEPGKGLLGGRFFSGESDTLITSNILVQSAVFEVSRRMLPGMEFVIVNQDEFWDKEKGSQIPLLIEIYQPDILISLTELIFFVNAHVNVSGITQVHVEELDSYTVGVDSHYNGDISIGYQAQWSITWVQKQNSKQIEQRGWVRSAYSKDYSLPQELFSCAKLAGADFVSLLRNE